MTKRRPPGRGYEIGKRAIDLSVSGIGLVVLSPILAIVSVVVRRGSPGPALYRASRSGIGGVPFTMLKFRTMVIDAESLGGPSTALNDVRFSRSGRLLRKYKIDELPQLWNVLTGDMSLVGPRPQVRLYTDRYEGAEVRILSVRPGITDLASIYFSDMDAVLADGDVDKRYLEQIEPVKNALRIRYVDERNLALDLRILAATALTALRIRNPFDFGFPVDDPDRRDDT